MSGAIASCCDDDDDDDDDVDKDIVCRAHFRVPREDDLFYRETTSVRLLTRSNWIMESFCSCDRGKHSTCGSKAVSDKTPDKFEPKDDVRIGVLHPIVGGQRRRKRQTDALLLFNDGRLYPTSYR